MTIAVLALTILTSSLTDIENRTIIQSRTTINIIRLFKDEFSEHDDNSRYHVVCTMLLITYYFINLLFQPHHLLQRNFLHSHYHTAQKYDESDDENYDGDDDGGDENASANDENGVYDARLP